MNETKMADSFFDDRLNSEKLLIYKRKLSSCSKDERKIIKKSRSSSSNSSSDDNIKIMKKKKKKIEDKKILKKLKKKLKKKKKKKEEEDKKLKKKISKKKKKIEIVDDKINDTIVPQEQIQDQKLNSSDDDRLLKDISIEVMERAKAMAPMTKEQWEKRQSVVRRVYDEETGRHRLIKGDGEILEEIVSRDRHRDINKQATRGDGEYFQSRLRLGK